MVYDSFERMSGYDYFAIIDHDEFFKPTKHKTLKEMLVISLYALSARLLISDFERAVSVYDLPFLDWKPLSGTYAHIADPVQMLSRSTLFANRNYYAKQE